ncbi:MAG: hypothetical protein ACI94Y_001657 [Maribacter sp.]|jgi:hypothetical protein
MKYWEYIPFKTTSVHVNTDGFFDIEFQSYVKNTTKR